MLEITDKPVKLLNNVVYRVQCTLGYMCGSRSHIRTLKVPILELIHKAFSFYYKLSLC
jgi:hypothetical protein